MQNVNNSLQVESMNITTEPPSPSTALSANSGTGTQEGRPTTRPNWSHSSDRRTGLGAVPLITPGKLRTNKLLVLLTSMVHLISIINRDKIVCSTCSTTFVCRIR
jgi:hypothetical protein